MFHQGVDARDLNDTIGRMAARLNKRHDDEARKKIQVSQLINRLQNEALGDLELRDGQRKAIEILLRKSLPDLSSITLTGDDDSPIAFRQIERVIVDPIHTDSPSV